MVAVPITTMLMLAAAAAVAAGVVSNLAVPLVARLALALHALDYPGGRKLQGIIGGSALPATFIPKLIELWRQGRFPFDRLVRTYPFADIATAWADTTAGRVVKPVLVMP